MLRRVSNGDLKIRASENYQSELLSKLGQVINQIIRRLFHASKWEFEKILLTGLSKEEILSRKCYEQFKGPYCYSDQCTLKQILAGIECVQKEMERVRDDGSKVYCLLLNAIPLYDWEGNIIGMVEDFADLTKFREAKTEVELYGMKMALGISDIFETLNQFSSGNFEARVKEDLKDELLNKLSKVINKTIINFGKSWEALESAKLYSDKVSLPAVS